MMILVDALIEQLSNIPASEETWTAKMTVMKELIEHHIEDEEEDMFKKMRKVCDASELKDMG